MTNKEFLESITLEGEEWRDVIGYEGLYVISSYGRIVVLVRPTRRGQGIYLRPPVLLKTKMSGRNIKYPAVCLWKNGKYITRTIHKLVALSFIPNPDNLPMVDHIDANPTNNHVANLRWTNAKGNMNNPVSIARSKFAQLSTPNKKRLKVACLKNGNLVKTYPSLYSTEQDGFTDSSVARAIHLNYPYRGYQWMYLSDYETSINKSKNA